jgi:hypothetical protein
VTLREFLSRNRRVLNTLRFATDVVGKLPARGDGALGFAIKLLAMTDSWEKTFSSKSSVYEDIFSKYDLRERSSEAFTRLFFGSTMRSRFELQRHGVSDHLELIEALAPDGERLFFQQHMWGRPEVASEFFHTPGFDFAGATRDMWTMHPDGLYLSVEPSRGGFGTVVTFIPLPAAAEPVTTRSKALLAELVAAAARPHTTLLYGPPGTGKSIMVAAIERQIGGGLLKVDATALPKLGVQELAFLVETLRPRVLLLDDFDRAPIEEARARVLFLFESLKLLPDVNVYVTVNDAKKLDEPLLRSQRIDEAVELGLPDVYERLELMRIAGLKVHPEGLGEATEGFNCADIVQLVQRTSFEDIKVALVKMKRLHALAAAAAKTDSKPGAAPDSPPKG